MDSNEKLSDAEMDIIRTIAEKGADGASRAISKMTNSSVKLTISKVYSFPIEKIGNLISDAEAIVTTIYLKITGDMAGSILLVFPSVCALSLVDLLNKRPLGATSKLSDFDKSTLKEVSNIISGSFLAVLSERLKLSLVESIPDLTVDMVQATIDSVLIDFAQSSDETISLEMTFKSTNQQIEGYFFVLFDSSSAKVILDSVRKETEKSKKTNKN